jgi:hypothetical protein
MDEKHVLRFQRQRQLLQEITILLGQNLPRPQYGTLCGLIEIGNVDPFQRGKIVIARDGGDFPLSQDFHALIGMRAVANHIAATKQGVQIHSIEIGQHLKQCGEVSVEVGKDANAPRGYTLNLHNLFPSIFSTSRPPVYGWQRCDCPTRLPKA